MSQILIVFLAIFALTSARSFDPYIVGGDINKVGDHPYQAYLTFETFSGAPDRHCAGVLVSPNAVLTTAVCVSGVGIGNAILGEVDLANLPSSQTVDVVVIKEVIINPAFNPTTFEANIAIVKFDRNVRLRDGVIGIIDYDRSVNMTHENQDAIVSGWGNSNFLKEASMRILNSVSCGIRYPDMKDTALCAANIMTSPCNGDEGAPLVMEMMGVKRVIGLYSHIRDNDCTHGWPAVYTRVTSYSLWIWLNL